ncbi:MAG: hypothetical protein WCL16_02205 [bacterium]
MKTHFSPSEYHARLMAQTVPALGYDGGDVSKWQSRLRRKLRQLVGDMPEERCELRPGRLWKRATPLGTIEKIRFTSEPCSDVVAYVCLPKGLKPPYTFMICLQGHSTGMHNSIAVQREDESRPHKVEGDRDFALGCMSRGIAALCIEQRSFGERREQKQKQVSSHGCHDATTPALLRVRAVVQARNEKDAGLTGRSGARKQS